MNMEMKLIFQRELLRKRQSKTSGELIDPDSRIIQVAQKGKQTAARVAQTAKTSSARVTSRQLSVAENLIRKNPKNIKMSALAATLGAGVLGYNYSRRRNG